MRHHGPRTILLASVLILVTAATSPAQFAALHHTFTSPAPSLRSEFGFRVALVGDDVLVGSASGSAAYLFDGGTGALARTFQKESPDPGDLFGFSVAAAGQNVLIAATLDDTGGDNAGAVYLFDVETGEILQTFLNPTPQENDEFGLAVASIGGSVLIGAPGDDTGAQDAGAAYLFDATTGNLLQIFQKAVPAEGDRFGSAVAISDNAVLIGAPNDDAGATDGGAAYLFDAATGGPLLTFQRAVPDSADLFGSAVLFTGSTVAVGAPFADAGASDAGAVDLFDPAAGSLLQTLRKPIPAASDLFGTSLGSAGANVIVGVPLDDTGAADAGALYIFEAATGDLKRRISNPASAADDHFGLALDASDTRIVTGAPGSDAGAVDAGTAYLFGPPLASLGVNKGFKGSKTSVPISLNDVSNILAGLFKISYDPAKLSLAAGDVKTATLTNGFLLAADIKQDEGSAVITVAGGTRIASKRSGALANLSFQVKNTADVSVGEAVDLTVTEATLILDDGGLRTVTPELRPGSLEVLLRGDMNGSQTIDLIDLVTVLRLALKLVANPTPLQLALADADGNGLVTIDDALLMIRNLTSAAKPAGSPQPVRISIPKLQARSGRPISVPIQITGGRFANGFDIEFLYDPSALHFEGSTAADAAGALVHDTRGQGVIRLLGVSRSGFPDGSLAHLHFTARSSGPVDLGIGTARILGPTADPLPFQISGDAEPALDVFRLRRNAPNPFNPATVVSYDLPEAADVRIEVYNAIGQHVETLLLAHQQAGRHQITWDAEGAASGLYLLVVQAGDVRETMKMLLLR